MTSQRKGTERFAHCSTSLFFAETNLPTSLQVLERHIFLFVDSLNFAKVQIKIDPEASKCPEVDPYSAAIIWT